MRELRQPYFRKLFTLFAGITFLNMSFILAEFSALGLNKNCQLIQNILNTGIEEEKEGSSEAGESETDSLKEIFLSMSENLNHHNIVFLIGQQISKSICNQAVCSGHKEIFSPPPES